MSKFVGDDLDAYPVTGDPKVDAAARRVYEDKVRARVEEVREWAEGELVKKFRDPHAYKVVAAGTDYFQFTHGDKLYQQEVPLTYVEGRLVRDFGEFPVELDPITKQPI